MTTERTPPHARMVNNKFDVSAYCQEPLVVALDHLSSVKFALFSLIRPALKIAARSLFIEHENVTISNILSHLNSDTPIDSPPPEARPQRPKRSFGQRIVHFFTVGIPLAIFVGIIAGILHFVKTIATDLVTVVTVGARLYSMSQEDVKFYKENPQLLPPRNVAIDGVVNTGLAFYSRRLIDRKLGMFAFIGRPLVTLVASILTNRLIGFFNRIDQYRSRQNNNRPTTVAPSAPPGPPPPYQEKANSLKFD